MQGYAMTAIEAVLSGKLSYSKFLSANDTGLTGGHQSGIYVSKPAVPILFNEPGEKGNNNKKQVKIKWQDDFETNTWFTYYGTGTRNEYRITNFGRGFQLLHPEHTGSLFILTKFTEDEYKAYVLDTEEEIEQFLDAFGMSPTETNQLIEMHFIRPEIREQAQIDRFIKDNGDDFPASNIMSAAARRIQNEVYDHRELILTDPDKKLIAWTDTEYRLFRALEYASYGDSVAKGFRSVDEFINMANQVLNRRKSRAGKSLEHHLAAIFDENKIEYTSQAVTEGNKKPDFLFPSEKAYHDLSFPVEQLVSLAAKTTCKDRWRQVLSEANRLDGGPKYLCTLQQGISQAQMDEMQEGNVVLVVPQPYISTYPKDRQERIWTVGRFVNYIRKLENRNG